MVDEGLIYFKDGKQLVEVGDTKIYKMNGQLFLEIGSGHTLWALESEIQDYMEQLSDLPKGNCLEIGLGLGVASRYILTFPKVVHLTTVEINSNVIEAHSLIEEASRGLQLDYNSCKHTIICSDGLEYMFTTKNKYDFIFIDCYDRIDEETLPMIADMYVASQRILKPNGKIVAWLDKYTPEVYYKQFESIFSQGFY